MPTLARVELAVALLALAGATSTALAAPCAGTGTQLCTDGTGDCTISDDCSVQSGLTLDLQGRRLVVAASKTLSIAGQGMLTLKANGIVLQAGAKILAPGDNTGAQVIVLTSTADFTLGDGLLIDASSAAGGGDIELYAPAGAFTSTGSIRANSGAGRDSDGGAVTMSTWCSRCCSASGPRSIRRSAR